MSSNSELHQKLLRYEIDRSPSAIGKKNRRYRRIRIRARARRLSLDDDGYPQSSPSFHSRRLFIIFMILIAIAIVSFLFWLNTSASMPPSAASTTDSQLSDAELELHRSWRRKLTVKPYRSSMFSTRNLSFDRIMHAGEQNEDAIFDMDDTDVLVFVHIQKTAGTTFEKFLTRHLDIEHPCKCEKGRKRCKCLRRPGSTENWLFSRYSTGWSCGLHADWTELVVSNCVDNVLDKKDGAAIKRRYFYTTFLREPIARTLSEFRHVERGATWSASSENLRYMCNGRPHASELPLCYDPGEEEDFTDGWTNVTLDAFLDCPHNMARNRQTRMLADLTLVGCYNTSLMPERDRNRIMLESAKRNLREMSFFGLQEHMKLSQRLFERVFRLNFRKDMSDWEISKSADTPVSDEQMEKLKSVNQLDLELYDYAERIFMQRVTEVLGETSNRDQFDTS